MINTKPIVVWITGLSGAGKTTIARALSTKVNNALVIDGDDLRAERPKLGFSMQDRFSNVYHATYKAITHVSHAQGIAIVSLISPLIAMRKEAKHLVEGYSNAKFIEVYMDIPLEICELRDPKGLYKQVRAGKIENFTGIDSPYETPVSPDITISPEMTIDQTVNIILDRVDNCL